MRRSCVYLGRDGAWGVTLCALLAGLAAGCGSAENPPADGAVPTNDGGTSDTPVTPDPDSGTPVMPVTPPPESAPPFDSATDAHVRDLVAAGRARGNRLDVFAKIGDSITESASFLFDCGYGWYDLGTFASLAPTIQYFSADAIDDRNSFNRASVSAVAGWTSDQALEGGTASPLVTELEATRPQWALIMYGTNDLDHVDTGTYRAHMVQILDIVEAHGVVPVLYTIPPRQDDPAKGALSAMFSDTIRALAAERHVPLIDFYSAMMNLPLNHGVSDDGIHPSIYVDPANETGDSCVFTTDGLQYGYNMRNLVTLEMLARLEGYAL